LTNKEKKVKECNGTKMLPVTKVSLIKNLSFSRKLIWLVKDLKEFFKKIQVLSFGFVTEQGLMEIFLVGK